MQSHASQCEPPNAQWCAFGGSRLHFAVTNVIYCDPRMRSGAHSGICSHINQSAIIIIIITHRISKL